MTLINEGTTLPKHSVHLRRKASKTWKLNKELCYLLASIIRVKVDFGFSKCIALHLTSCIKRVLQSLIKRTCMVQLIP